SAFDKWLRGDENALTAQQKHGYQLFKENKCATCHGGIILGGRSNIHQGGTPPVEAAAVIVDLAKRMLEQKASGINMTR
ncbi:ethanolamine ammonia-lyase light chain EutC, partial [Salmonella enterica subsp. enterica serovar Kentucky]|nr:ethanolamine ammonia-lyase light chain EutC [Salmonella enterica subsp. enterica serovar Kentucky]